MRWITRLLVAAGVVVVLAAGVLVAGSLLSLDWERRHAAQTGQLPLVSRSAPDGLVRIPAGDRVFRARVAGLAGAGPGVILLHGFPETSAMWTPLLEPAAAAGLRVVAFDQRGYSPGARPADVADYAVPEVVADVLAVADALGFGRFHLAGHDWGAIAGWGVVLQHPERVRSWTALSIPHPGTLLESMQASPPGYIRFFQTPWLPELVLTFDGLALLRENYAAMPDEQTEEYLAVFSEPGALGAALAWYRALPLSIDSAAGAAQEIERPVLYIGGDRDPYVSLALLERQRELLTGPYEELVLDAGHWLMQEETGRVVDAVLAHLRNPREGAASGR